MRNYRRVERGDIMHFEYNPDIKRYQLRIPGPIDPGTPSKHECLVKYEDKYGKITYLTEGNQQPPNSKDLSEPTVALSAENAMPKLSDSCAIADGKIFANNFYYGISEDGLKMQFEATHSPINIDVLRGEVPKWNLASVPSPLLTIPLESLAGGNDAKAAAEISALHIVTRTLYTLTCPYNPVEVVLDDKKVMISDFPNGPIHSILIELRQPVYNTLTVTLNQIGDDDDNRPAEKPGWSSMSITLFVNDASFLPEMLALLPGGQIQSEMCSMLPRIVIDADALPLGTEVHTLSQCMQNVNAYLSAGKYLDNPVQLPFIPFPAELIAHFNKTLSDYAALCVNPLIKITPDGIEHHARYTYITPQDQLLSNWAPYQLSYTFDPEQHSHIPDGLTPLMSALLYKDIKKFDQILAEDPSQIYARDAWGTNAT